MTGSGYCRSEAVVSLFLQKAAHSKRIYAHLVHSKNNSDGFKNQGICLMFLLPQVKFIAKIYCI